MGKWSPAVGLGQRGGGRGGQQPSDRPVGTETIVSSL